MKNCYPKISDHIKKTGFVFNFRLICSYLEVSSDRFEIMEKEPKIIESTEDGEIKGKSCQLIPGGFAGTGPNGSFFECPEWVDQSKVR